MSEQNSDNAIITIGKDKLATLPAASCTAGIVVVDRLESVDAAIDELRKADIIGFDTETRPSFKKGQTFGVALIQLATPSICYLFRINQIGLPQQLIDLLEDPNLLKVGVSIHDDFHQLSKLAKINPQSFVDLQSFVKGYKIADNSLSRIHGILFGERVSKGQRLTNWEAPELTEQQQRYAALDAEACIKIYKFLQEGKFDPYTSEYLTFPAPPESNPENES